MTAAAVAGGNGDIGRPRAHDMRADGPHDNAWQFDPAHKRMAVKEGEQPGVATHVWIEGDKLSPPLADRGIIQP